MKIWTKVHLNEQDKNVDLISKAFVNYLYGFGPVDDICRKYNICKEDKESLDRYTANRIAGILLLYLAKDTKRINDIVNKYNLDNSLVKVIQPEIEGYINK